MANLPDFQTVLRQIGERVLCRDRGIPVSELDSELERLGNMVVKIDVARARAVDAVTKGHNVGWFAPDG
jgi:hypothetical protein